MTSWRVWCPTAGMMSAAAWPCDAATATDAAVSWFTQRRGRGTSAVVHVQDEAAEREVFVFRVSVETRYSVERVQ